MSDSNESDSEEFASPMRVWVRPMGLSWKVRLESREHAEQLRSSLAASGAQCSHPASPPGTGHSLVFVSFPVHTTHNELSHMIAAIPNAELMHDPA